MIFGGDRKNGGIPQFDGKRPCLKKIRGYGTGEGEVEIGTLWLGNDKINSITDNVLSRFQSLITKFEVQVSCFGTKTINFLLANTDLLKRSVFIFFNKKYLQKPHPVMMEIISSNKTWLQLKLVFK